MNIGECRGMVGNIERNSGESWEISFHFIFHFIFIIQGLVTAKIKLNSKLPC